MRSPNKVVRSWLEADNYALKSFAGNFGAMFGTVAVLCGILLAVFASHIAPYGPFEMPHDSLVSPNRSAIMGADSLGRDVFSRFLFGAQASLFVGVSAAALGIFIGVVIGSISGYFGGAIDATVMRVTELFQVVPRFILALVVVAMIGSGLDRIIMVIGLLSWPPSARIVRSQFLTLRDREFVQAARIMGMPHSRIIVREILPNAIAPAIVIASMDIAQAILLEASLSFLGLGDPNIVSWGTMIQDAQSYFREAWWLSVFPGLGILFLVLGFNLIGDGLNDAIDPKQRGR